MKKILLVALLLGTMISTFFISRVEAYTGAIQNETNFNYTGDEFSTLSAEQLSTRNLLAAQNDTYEANARYIGNYNVVAFDSLVADQSTVEGAIAVRNLLDAPRTSYQTFSVGSAYSGSKFQHIGLPFSETSQPALLLEKNQTSTGLFVLQGDTVMATNTTYQNVNSAYNVYKKDPTEIAAIFDGWRNDTNSFIETVKRMQVGPVMSGGSTNSSMGVFTFNSSTNVDNVAVSVLANNGGTAHVNEFNITPEVNAKDYIVVYSDAPKIQFGSSWGAAMYNNQIINFNELYNGQNPVIKQLAQKIVYVFPNATEVAINNFSVPGTIVSPNAKIIGKGGSINGQAITSTIEQTNGFDVRNFHFSYLDSDTNKFDFNDVTQGSITAEDFSICFCDFQTVTDQQLISLAKANAVDSEGNLVKITAVDRTQLTGQTLDGVYPLTFTSEDNQTVTINVTLYHKNYTVDANDLSFTPREFNRITRSELIQLANVTVTSPSGIVDKNNYTVKIDTTLKFNKIPAVGVYQVKFIADTCFEKVITVTITEEVIPPTQYRINTYRLCFCDVTIYTDQNYIDLANVREYNTTTGVFEKVTNITEVDKSSLVNAKDPGIYQVIYKTADNKTYTTDVELYTKDYMLSAENVIYDKALFNENSVDEILLKSNYQIYDPVNEVYLSLADVNFQYTTQLVNTFEADVNNKKYNVTEYLVTSSVDICYKQDFTVYLTEEIPVPPIDPVDPVPPIEPTIPDINKLPDTGFDTLTIMLGISGIALVSLVTRKLFKK